MPIEITKNEAANMYLAQLQSEMMKLNPVDRTIKRFSGKTSPTAKVSYFSYVDLIAAVQNRTYLGVTKAVEYVQQLLTPDGEQQYLIVG